MLELLIVLVFSPFFVPPGIYNVERIYSDSLYANYCSILDSNIVVQGGDTLSSVVFSDTLRRFTKDLSVEYVNATMFVVDEMGSIHVRVKNQGDTILSGIVKVVISNSDININNAIIPNYIGVIGDTILVQNP